MTPDSIPEQTRALRALARALIRNVHDADDVVQNSWLSLLQHPPRDRSRPQAWLSTVVANHARQHWRAEARRARRESWAARRMPKAVVGPGTYDTDLHAIMMEALRELPAIHRTAVQLRFLEGLRPAEIARRLRVPAETIRSRIHRGLEQMRGVLQRTGRVGLRTTRRHALGSMDG